MNLKEIENKKTMEKKLEEHGWQQFTGFCFPTPPADEPEYNLTFVNEEDVWDTIKKGVRTYWQRNPEVSDNYTLYDLEDAFYELYEDLDLDIDFDEWEKEILKGG